MERLQKYLSRAGVASRRAAEELIVEGRVKVNGKVVKELGSKVLAHKDRVELDGQVIEVDERYVYLLLNKPQKYICSMDDPEGRAVVTELIPPQFGRVYPVGRLDWDSEGALLMTNDGELTNLLTHPRHEVEKTYMVKVTGLVDNMDARIERARGGVVLDDGYRTLPSSIFRDSDTGLHTWFVVTIREGKNRQIRRMFETVGLDVRRLKRISYGPLMLGDLGYGEWRRLAEFEVETLYAAAGGQRGGLASARGRLSPSMAARQNLGGALAREARAQVQKEETRAAEARDAHMTRGTRGDRNEGEYVSREQARETEIRQRREAGARDAGTSSRDGGSGSRDAGAGSREGSRPAAPRSTGGGRTSSAPRTDARPAREGGRSSASSPGRGTRGAGAGGASTGRSGQSGARSSQKRSTRG
jgi:23S rRNA pseudouridine2605 synthase